MIGHVDSNGRALVTITTRQSTAAIGIEIEAWIDTGFNGDLVLPQLIIGNLGLVKSGIVSAILADGSEVRVSTYALTIEWFGVVRSLEVVANDGECPLLGVGLLLDHDLHISYRSGNINIV